MCSSDRLVELCSEQRRWGFGDNDVIERKSISRTPIDLGRREGISDRTHEALVLAYRQVRRGMRDESSDIVGELLCRSSVGDQNAHCPRQRQIRQLIAT